MSELFEAHKLALQNVYKNSFYAFAKHLCGYSDIAPHAHGDMIRCLESPSPRKMVVMPRGTFKTTISSVAYPLWLLLHNPNLRIMLDSEIYTNSKMRLREIKGILKSKAFIEVFGDWEGPLWSDGEIITSKRSKVLKEPTIFASGIGASKTGIHCDVIIADDLNTPKNSLTAEQAEKVLQHYRYYTSILEPNGTIIIVGTRYSTMDVIGNIIANELEADQIEQLKREGFL